MWDDWGENAIKTRGRATLTAATTPLWQRLRRTNGGSVSRVRAGNGVGQGYKKTQVRGGGQSASIRQEARVSFMQSPIHGPLGAIGTGFIVAVGSWTKNARLLSETNL